MKIETISREVYESLRVKPTLTNEERGKLEQYDIVTSPPYVIFAYVGDSLKNGMGIDREVGCTYPITTWTGDPIGFASIGSKWRVNSFMGSHLHQFYAVIAGREYTGRGFGSGMCVRLKETAESKRKRA